MFPQKGHSMMYSLKIVSTRMFLKMMVLLRMFFMMNLLKMVSELSSAKRFSNRFLLERIS